MPLMPRSNGADWIFGVNVLSLSFSHDSSYCPEVLRRVGTSRRSRPLSTVQLRLSPGSAAAAAV